MATLEDKKDPKHYYLRKKYYVVEIDGVKQLARVKTLGIIEVIFFFSLMV